MANIEYPITGVGHCTYPNFGSVPDERIRSLVRPVSSLTPKGLRITSDGFVTPREPRVSSAEGCPAPLPSYPFRCLAPVAAAGRVT